VRLATLPYVLPCLLVASSVSAADCSIGCDLNGDGKFSNLDYVAFYSAYNSKMGDARFNPRADFDASGTITPVDYGFMLRFCPL
jgi:hypothetical protein